MSDADIDFYMKSCKVMGKAGAYAIQGLASLWIKRIDGCYFNVVGLPVRKLYECASQIGVDFAFLCGKEK